MVEEWKDFLDGFYQVSNVGNIRRAKDGENTFAGRQKALCVNSSGYYLIGANINGARKNIYAHRAVAEAFLGAIPGNYVINHKDGNKLNNHVDNLEIVTISENARHAVTMGLASPPTQRARGEKHWTKKHPDKVKRGEENGAVKHPEKIWRGEQCKSSKLTSEMVVEIKKMIVSGASDLVISKQFNVTRKNINSIRNEKTWKHIKC